MTPLGWSILLLLLGLVFLVLEFFIPSGGALAVMCALSFLAAIIVGFMGGPWAGAAAVLANCVIVPSSVCGAAPRRPHAPRGQRRRVQRTRRSRHHGIPCQARRRLEAAHSGPQRARTMRKSAALRRVAADASPPPAGRRRRGGWVLRSITQASLMGRSLCFEYKTQALAR